MPAAVSQKLRRFGPRFVRGLAWFYLAVVLAVVLLFYMASDSSWPMTLLCLGPRWVSLLPAIVLIPGALLLCRRALGPILLASVVAGSSIMGFCMPWRSWLEPQPQAGLPIRMVTINIGNLDDRAGLFKFLRDAKADVIAIQEWAGPQKVPPELGADWHRAGEGQLMVISRFPIITSAVSPRGQGRWYSPSLRCDIQTPAGLIHVHCLHLYTLRKGLEAVLSTRWKGVPELKRVIAIRNDESEIASRFAGETQNEPTIVLGDFNMTGDSVIFRQHWSGWQDAFAVRGFGRGYTFGTRKIGLRIDHVLADSARWQTVSCRVGPDFRGQHRPLVADFVLRSEK